MSSKTANQNSNTIVVLKEHKHTVECLNLESNKTFVRVVCTCGKWITPMYAKDGLLCADCQIDKIIQEYLAQTKEADRYGL
jgi:hypothetical protein